MQKGESITYEWLIEEIDPYGDIVENHFFNSLNDACSITPDEGNQLHLSLVKYIGSERDGILDHNYATVKNGMLRNYFGDLSAVPYRFKAEYLKYYPTLTLIN